MCSGDLEGIQQGRNRLVDAGADGVGDSLQACEFPGGHTGATGSELKFGMADAYPHPSFWLTFHLTAGLNHSSGTLTCVSLVFLFPKDLEGVPPSKKMKLEASQQNSEEM